MTQNRGYYVQIPGLLSRRAVLDVGLYCVHSCKMCFYREPERGDKDFEMMRTAKFRPKEQLLRQVDLMAENGFIACDITGGETTLHPDLVEIVQRMTDRGIAGRVITLGQFLTTKKDLLGRLIDAGLADFRLSYHSCDPDIFKKITGGHLEKIEAAMDELDRRGFEYYTNTTVQALNYKTLPDIAYSMTKRRIYHADFLFMMGLYSWSTEADKELRAQYTEAASYLREAVGILEDHGIAVGIRYAPHCIVAGMEKNYVGSVAVRHDPHEWMNTVEHTGPGDAERESKFITMRPDQPAPGSWIVAEKEKGPFMGRGSQGGVSKLFTPKCQQCSALAVCDGIDKSYLDRHGLDEFIPHIGDHRGVTLDRDRLEYKAGFVAKLKPDGKPSVAVKRLLKQKYNLWRASGYPPVSIIVPNYNHGRELERCLQSLAAQTYRGSMDIVIVDDASTDHSVKVIEDFIAAQEFNAIRTWMIIRREENSGGLPAVPRNQGVQSSRGDLVMCIDPDDWIAPTCIAEAVEVFRVHPEVSVVNPGIQTFGMETVLWQAIPFDAAREIQGNYIGYCSMYRRSMYDEIGGYDESPELKGVEDWNFWVSAVRLGHSVAPLPRQLVHYCRSEGGLFETEVKPNFNAKRAAVYARNQEVYAVEMLELERTQRGKPMSD